jgi:hypothetical protein
MLWTITVILLVLWLLGVVGVYTIGAWIHLLLVLASSRPEMHRLRTPTARLLQEFPP